MRGGLPRKSFTKAFNSAVKRAGLKTSKKHVTPYSIRHTLARYMGREGVPDQEISIFLGHERISKKRTTRRYNPIDPYGPNYLVHATAAVEKFVREIALRCKRDILTPPWSKK